MALSIRKWTDVPAERGDLLMSGPDEHLPITNYMIPYVPYGHQILIGMTSGMTIKNFDLLVTNTDDAIQLG
jgi:hypothetical protein